uniref:Reverse transcriptase domain-containing protein n=1 Tax=Sphaeramia orbicularis TaxID=375764 RepID=A0A672ZIM2_9TELE
MVPNQTGHRVKSGIPQGRTLGLILFLIFINDMLSETICPTELFANDARPFERVQTLEDCQKIQDDVNMLRLWAVTWQLRFHTVLRVDRKHPDYKYYMMAGENQVKPAVSDCDKDLSIHVDERLNCQKQLPLPKSARTKVTKFTVTPEYS